MSPDKTLHLPRQWVSSLLPLLLTGSAFAQSANVISASSASAKPGDTVTLDISLKSVQPTAALQWELSYPIRFLGTGAGSVTTGPVTLNADKQLLCADLPKDPYVVRCMITGPGQNNAPIKDGVVAHIKLLVNSDAPDGAAAVTLRNAISVAPVTAPVVLGKKETYPQPIPTTTENGTVTITQKTASVPGPRVSRVAHFLRLAFD